MISSSQRPLHDSTQHSQQTYIHAPTGIRTHDLSSRAAADLRPRPRGHCRSPHTILSFSSQRPVSIRTDTEMLLNSFRLNNRIRFDIITLLAETERQRERDSEIFLPNLPLKSIFTPEGFNAFFLSARICHSYLNFAERGNITYVHSFLKNQYILPSACTLDACYWTSIQPEGAGQSAMSHGTQRRAP